MEDLKKVLDLMFLPTDTICVSDNSYANHSVPISSVLSGEVTLVSPSQKIPNRQVATNKLTHLALNPILGFRKDSNVYRLQTFLWEIDVGSLSSQCNYIKSLGIPYSLAVFSGNKSIHFATVLEEPVDLETYKLLFKWTCNIATLFDDQCGNPSRCLRIPGSVRPDTNKLQRLVEIKGKVKLEDFLTWLNKYEHLKPKPRTKEKKELTNEADYSRLSKWLIKALKNNDLDFSKGRNHRWYAVFYDFATAGYSQDEAESILENYFNEESDFKRREWLNCAKSAYEHVRKE